MKHLLLAAKTDMSESLRSRWFMVYTLVFGGVIVALFMSGLTESRVMGFSGLSRVLVTYLQITMAILPVFVLITTVRSVAGDREAGVFEYMLSLPVSLFAWFWGKMLGRFVVVFLPVFLAMFAAVAWGLGRDIEIPWQQVIYYTGFLLSLAWCFLGIGMLVSTLARSSDVATGIAFIIWLGLLLVIVLALFNPMQVFRTAAMMLFDPQLVLLGQSAYVILDNFGKQGYILWALLYPVGLGTVCAWFGYVMFKRSDLP
jgi:ABC-2 type transport system permease protein